MGSLTINGHINGLPLTNHQRTDNRTTTDNGRQPTTDPTDASTDAHNCPFLATPVCRIITTYSRLKRSRLKAQGSSAQASSSSLKLKALSLRFKDIQGYARIFKDASRILSLLRNFFDNRVLTAKRGGTK